MQPEKTYAQIHINYAPCKANPFESFTTGGTLWKRVVFQCPVHMPSVLVAKRWHAPCVLALHKLVFQKNGEHIPWHPRIPLSGVFLLCFHSSPHHSHDNTINRYCRPNIEANIQKLHGHASGIA